MNSSNEMKILVEILNDESNRMRLIKQFQHEVWDDKGSNNLLAELAFDLDFYEPNEEYRKQDPSYYGDKRLEEILTKALEELASGR